MMNLKIDKNEYIKGLNRNSLLIIDDFGMERDTPFALEQIYNIIDSRYTASKPLIVTTNLNHAEMLKTDIQTDYRRIYDRVLEMCVPIYFEGESKRTQNAKQKLEKLKEILG
jgi:DNA replication protein DnaC